MKLPQEVNCKLEEIRTDVWTIESLRKSTHQLILAREKTEENVLESVYNEECPEYTSEGLFSKEIKVKCCFCEKGHWADECQRYKTLEERKAMIKGRCFVCLGTDHLFRNCKNDKPCFYCRRRRHQHSSLCPEKFGKVKDESETNLLGSALSSYANQEVLMKIAKVEIKNPVSGRTDTATVLMDTGAKHSYITSEKAKRLGIEGNNSTTVKLNTFGTDEQSTIQTKEAAFMIKLRDGTYMHIQAKTCNTVTGTITKKKISMQKYSNICKDLIMADELPDRDRRTNVDILIGNDYYEDIIKAEKIDVDSGMYLVNSAFGWMFSGRTEGRNKEEECMLVAEEEHDFDRTFWELETVGISSVTKISEDAEVIQ